MAQPQQQFIPHQIHIAWNVVINIHPVFAAPPMSVASFPSQPLQAIIQPAIQSTLDAFPKDIPLPTASHTSQPTAEQLEVVVTQP